MSYVGISVIQQLLTFLYAMSLGGILSLVYDVFRIARIAFGGKTVVVFVQDVIFSLIALVLTFMFVITLNNGELRFFVLLGEFLGFLIYYFTIGKIVMFFSKAIIKAIKITVSAVTRPIAKLFAKIKGKISSKRKKHNKKHLKSDK